MGLFDKFLAKEPKTPAQQPVEPVNATGATTVGETPAAPQVAAAPTEPLPAVQAVGGVTSDPIPAINNVNVNPSDMFSNGETKEDAITKMVAADNEAPVVPTITPEGMQNLSNEINAEEEVNIPVGPSVTADGTIVNNSAPVYDMSSLNQTNTVSMDDIPAPSVGNIISTDFTGFDDDDDDDVIDLSGGVSEIAFGTGTEDDSNTINLTTEEVKPEVNTDVPNDSNAVIQSDQPVIDETLPTPEEVAAATAVQPVEAPTPVVEVTPAPVEEAKVEIPQVNIPEPGRKPIQVKPEEKKDEKVELPKVTIPEPGRKPIQVKPEEKKEVKVELPKVTIPEPGRKPIQVKPEEKKEVKVELPKVTIPEPGRKPIQVKPEEKKEEKVEIPQVNIPEIGRKPIQVKPEEKEEIKVEIPEVSIPEPGRKPIQVKPTEIQVEEAEEDIQPIINESEDIPSIFLGVNEKEEPKVEEVKEEKEEEVDDKPRAIIDEDDNVPDIFKKSSLLDKSEDKPVVKEVKPVIKVEEPKEDVKPVFNVFDEPKEDIKPVFNVPEEPKEEENEDVSNEVRESHKLFDDEVQAALKKMEERDFEASNEDEDDVYDKTITNIFGNIEPEEDDEDKAPIKVDVDKEEKTTEDDSIRSILDRISKERDRRLRNESNTKSIMDEVNAKASEEETPQENPFSAPDEDIAIKEEEEVSSVNPFDRHEEEVEEKPKREKAFNFNTIVHKEKANEVVDEFDSPEVLEIKNKARFCENCGTMITDDMTICPTCGEPIK